MNINLFNENFWTDAFNSNLKLNNKIMDLEKASELLRLEKKYPLKKLLINQMCLKKLDLIN